MNFDNVVVAGCSLTWGDELVDREQRFAARVARHYKAKLHDFSRNGSSNELISNSVINNTTPILKDGTIHPNNTLVIVQWSHRERFHYYSKTNQYYRVCHEISDTKHIRKAKHKGVSRLIDDQYVDNMDLKLFFENHSQPAYMTYNIINRIHHTQMFLQNKNLKYIFVFATEFELNSFYLDKKELDVLRTYGEGNSKYHLPDVSNMLADIDKTRLHPYPFLRMCKDKKFPKAIGDHPLEDAHIEYSKHLIYFVEKLYA